MKNKNNTDYIESIDCNMVWIQTYIFVLNLARWDFHLVRFSCKIRACFNFSTVIWAMIRSPYDSAKKKWWKKRNSNYSISDRSYNRVWSFPLFIFFMQNFKHLLFLFFSFFWRRNHVIYCYLTLYIWSKPREYSFHYFKKCTQILRNSKTFILWNVTEGGK